MPCFTHLHVHSTYSDGLATPSQLVAQAKLLGYTHLALTDHNTLAGHSVFAAAAYDHHIIPLLGVEVNVYLGEQRGHTVLLPRTSEEYAYVDWLIRRKKRIQLGDLRRVGIVTSGCLGGIMAQHLKGGDYWSARDTLLQLADTLGDAFYIEVQPTFGAILPWVLSLSRELHIHTVATNDVHYLAPADAMQFKQAGLYLATEEQMRQSCLYYGFQEAIENTGVIAARCASARAA